MFKDPKIKLPMPNTTPTAKRSRSRSKNHLKAMASQCKEPARKEAFPAIGALRKAQTVLGVVELYWGVGEEGDGVGIVGDGGRGSVSFQWLFVLEVRIVMWWWWRRVGFAASARDFDPEFT